MGKDPSEVLVKSQNFRHGNTIQILDTSTRAPSKIGPNLINDIRVWIFYNPTFAKDQI